MNSVEAGVTFGFAASFILAFIEIVGANALGLGAMTPLRWAASVIIGEGALSQPMPHAATFTFAATAHLLLTAFHGVVFCSLVRALPLGGKLTLLGYLAAGAAYGAFIWLFNFQIFGHTAMPWFLEAGQMRQLLIHVLAFGAPMGLFFGLSERAEFRAMQRTQAA